MIFAAAACVVFFLVLEGPATTEAFVGPALATQSAPRHRPRIAVAAKDIHELGYEFKDRGVAYSEKASAAKVGPSKMGYCVAAAAYLAMFTAYRAYRGFFVILPAVFVEVRAKLERRELASLPVDDDVDPKTGKLKLRSTILMNIGAVIFTTVFVVTSGLNAVLAKLLKKNDGTPTTTTTDKEEEHQQTTTTNDRLNHRD